MSGAIVKPEAREVDEIVEDSMHAMLIKQRLELMDMCDEEIFKRAGMDAEMAKRNSLLNEIYTMMAKLQKSVADNEPTSDVSFR